MLALITIVALIVGLHGLSRLGLRGPSGRTRSELESWFDDPLRALATILRWVALVMAYYLAAILAAVIATGNQVDDSLLRFLLPTRLATTIGLTIGIGAVVIPLSGHMARTAEPLESAAVESLHLTRLDEALTLEHFEPDDGDSPRPIPQDGLTKTPTKISRPDADHLWTVAPGDSFWAIADEHLQDSWEREVTEAEVATYWTQLIAANTDRLVEPGNPDLLLPGQVLTLPELPPVTR